MYCSVLENLCIKRISFVRKVGIIILLVNQGVKWLTVVINHPIIFGVQTKSADMKALW